MQSFGERIAYYRKERGFTQEALAEKCSVTAQAVSKWENDITTPDISLLPTLVGLFGITADELLGIRRADAVALKPEQIDLSKMLFRVRVFAKDGAKVNVNLPVAVAEVVLKNERFTEGVGEGKLGFLKDLNLAEIIALVQSGATGKLVEAENAGGDRVEVFVE